MKEPLCQKCGGWLEYYEDSSLWICKGCGSEYIYKESFPNNEMLSLQQMGGTIKSCEGQIIYASQQFESILSQLNILCLENSSLLKYNQKIGELVGAFQYGFKLLQDSFSSSNQLIEELQIYCTPCDGGHYELINIE